MTNKKDIQKQKNKKTKKQKKQKKQKNKKTKKQKNKKTKKGGAAQENTESNLKKINTINGVDYYRITIDSCQHYIMNRFNLKYIYIAPSSSNYYSKIPSIIPFERETPLLPQETIDEIIQKVKTEDEKKEDNDKVAMLRKNYSMLYFEQNKCFTPFNLLKAKEKLNELNTVLKMNYSFYLDYLYNYESIKNVSQSHRSSIAKPTDLFLCMNHFNTCVSSIQLTIENDSITIDTSTSKSYEKRGYNKLLSCVVFILAPLIGEIPFISKIKAHAVNPISAYSLVRHFNGIILSDNTPETEKLKQMNVTSPDFKELLMSSNRMFDLNIECPVNNDTVDKNNIKFKTYVDELK